MWLQQLLSALLLLSVNPPSQALIEWAKVFLSVVSPIAALAVALGAWKFLQSGERVHFELCDRWSRTDAFAAAVERAREVHVLRAWQSIRDEIESAVSGAVTAHNDAEGAHQAAIDHRMRNILQAKELEAARARPKAPKEPED